MAIFTRQLSTLIESGLPVQQSIDVLVRQNIGLPLGPRLMQVRHLLDQGRGLSVAMQRQSDVFGSMYVAMVASGEAHGRLAESLHTLAGYLERDAEMRQRVAAALSYPLLVLAVTGLLTWGVFTFALPAFLPIFSSMNAELPLPTRILMGLVAVAGNPFATALVLALLGAMGWALRDWLRKPQGIVFWDNFLLTFPPTAALTRKVVLGRIARSMATTMRSGLNAMESLLQISNTCGNVVYQNDLVQARLDLKQGLSMSEHCKRSRALYPPLFIHMLASGETTGRLDDLMKHLSDAYDQDVGYSIEVMLAMVEPMLMAVLSVIVGFIMISLFLPLYSFLHKL